MRLQEVDSLKINLVRELKTILNEELNQLDLEKSFKSVRSIKHCFTESEYSQLKTVLRNAIINEIRVTDDDNSIEIKIFTENFQNQKELNKIHNILIETVEIFNNNTLLIIKK